MIELGHVLNVPRSVQASRLGNHKYIFRVECIAAVFTPARSQTLQEQLHGRTLQIVRAWAEFTIPFAHTNPWNRQTVCTELLQKSHLHLRNLPFSFGNTLCMAASHMHVRNSRSIYIWILVLEKTTFRFNFIFTCPPFLHMQVPYWVNLIPL